MSSEDHLKNVKPIINKYQLKSKLIQKHNLINILKYQNQLENNEKRLMRAVTTNNFDKVEELLQSNVNPNISDNLLRTPLHLAASRNYKDIVNILLKYGADPNQRDIIGNTALHLAACSNNIDIVTLLLEAGTDVTSLDKLGRNPLQLAESKLKLLQSKHRDGFIEMTQLRSQLQQVIMDNPLVSCSFVLKSSIP